MSMLIDFLEVVGFCKLFYLKQEEHVVVFFFKVVISLFIYVSDGEWT